jgi:hypothetical protein
MQWNYAGNVVTGRIADVSGYWITEDYGGSNPRRKYFGFLSAQTVGGGQARIATGKLDELFPLAVGKTARYEFTFERGTSVHRVKVIGTEKVTVAAGTFDTFVIDWEQEGLGRNVFVGTARVWYAPSIGSSVKVNRRIVSGPEAGRDVKDELLAITPP